MYCAECGIELPLNSKFCFKCGQSVYSTAPPVVDETFTPSPEASPQPTVEEISTLSPAEAPQPMVSSPVIKTKWLKFWCYFSLPFGGLLGILLFLGLPGGYWSIILGLGATLNFIVAYGLHYRMLWAWQLNWVLIGATCLSGIFSAITLSQQTPHHSSPASLIMLIFIDLVIYGICWLWPNYVYWKKRRVLFF